MLSHQEPSIEFDHDSFDNYFNEDYEMQNSEVPSAIPINFTSSYKNAHGQRSINTEEGNIGYELTFKKEKQYVNMGNLNKKYMPAQNLFQDHAAKNEKIPNIISKQSQLRNPINPQDQKLIDIIHKSQSLSQIYKVVEDLQSLKALLKQQQLKRILEQNQLDEITQIKIETLIQMIALKNLRKKRNSAKLNIEVMKATLQGTEISEADKRRLELLELLVTQLEKKILIQGLRYNKMRIFYNKIMIDLAIQDQDDEELFHNTEQNADENKESMFNNEFISHTISKQKQQNFQTNDPKLYKRSPLKTSHTPTYVSPAKQTIYYNPRRLTIFNQNIASIVNKILYNAWKKIQVYQPNIKNRNQNISNINSGMGKASKQKYIISKSQYYGQEQQPEECENYEQNYANYTNQDQQNNHQQHNNEYTIERNRNLSEQEYCSIAEQKDLKQQKFQLKLYLRNSKILLFFRNLSENRAERQLKAISQNIYLNNLKKKAFHALYNVVIEKQIEDYADYVADNQNMEREKEMTLYFKTNMLALVFFGLKNYTKCLKFTNRIQKSILKLAFLSLKFDNKKQQNNQIKLQKFLSRKKKQTLFKFFNGFKNQTSFSYENMVKIENFRQRRNLQLLEIGFSVLSLQWKKKLTLIKRVQGMRLTNRAIELINQLSLNLERKEQQNILDIHTNLMVGMLQKQKFFIHLKKLYIKSLKRRKLQVKMTKLQIQLAKNYAFKGLFGWKRQHLLSKNYKIIERKLMKVKQSQQKQQLWKIWRARLAEKLNQQKKDKLTTNHKIWLNKYYQKLCALQQQQEHY